MNELVLYALAFATLAGHCLLAGKMYRMVHHDHALDIKQKNEWKLKALVFPGYFWWQYKKTKL